VHSGFILACVTGDAFASALPSGSVPVALIISLGSLLATCASAAVVTQGEQGAPHPSTAGGCRTGGAAVAAAAAD
jgi:hypothetical protein